MDELRNKLGCVVLAAGEASRMGQPKQLLQWKGKSLLQHALNKGHAVSDWVVVVSGAYSEAIEKEAGAVAHTWLVHNPDWATGMGSSIACGVQKMLEINPTLAGILIVLVDQPLVSQTALNAMIARWEAEKPAYIAAYYCGKRGVPALFSSALFSGLQALHGKGGAKQLMEKQTALGIEIPLPEAELDVDTPEEWNTFLQLGLE